MSKLKRSADDNFTFDENSRKFSKRVENTVGKGEIARYEQFLLFPQCFQKACFSGVSKGVIVWEWVKQFYATQQNIFIVKILRDDNSLTTDVRSTSTIPQMLRVSHLQLLSKHLNCD